VTLKIVFLDRATLSPQTTLRRPAFPHEMQLHERTSSEEASGLSKPP
jgi:glycerate dehydrogenase